MRIHTRSNFLNPKYLPKFLGALQVVIAGDFSRFLLAVQTIFLAIFLCP